MMEMEMEIERIDHLGVVAGVIQDLNLIDLINEHMGTDSREEISAGDAVVAMVLNGLGFSNKPLSLTPQFFEKKPLELLFGKPLQASYFNRSKLGRVLDDIYSYGCEKLFYQLASLVCLHEQIDTRFNSEDTTSVSLHGEYDRDCDEQALKLTHGYSKDHRPDLKQVVHEMMVSQDGGVPLMIERWDGNCEDNKIFKARTECLIETFSKSEQPRYLVADSKLYSKRNAENLSQLGFITRIPGTLKEERLSIELALKADQWLALDDSNRYYTRELNHYGVEQRWIVVQSDAAKRRAEKSVRKAINAELVKLKSKLKQLEGQAYGCKADAEAELERVFKQVKYYQLSTFSLEEKKHYSGRGRPKQSDEAQAITYHIKSSYEVKESVKTQGKII